jgi:hypothetical protein
VLETINGRREELEKRDTRVAERARIRKAILKIDLEFWEPNVQLLLMWRDQD